MFSGCTAQPDRTGDRTLRNNLKEASQLAGKNIGVILEPRHQWKCAHTAISGQIFPIVPGCHLLWKMTSQCGSQIFFQS